MSADLDQARHILRASNKILLVDWPNPEVPRALLNAGFTVFGFSPNGFTEARLHPEYPQEVNPKSIFPPKSKEQGFLVFHSLDGPPATVDIVNAYRPETEQVSIITTKVLPFEAKCFWIQPPATSSPTTRKVAMEHGLKFIEGIDIGKLASELNQ